MEKIRVMLCLCLLAAGCESPPASSAKVSPDEVVFLSAPAPDGHRVGWTSFNDHLTRHYPEDAMTQMRQDAARKGANVVVLLGIDPPNNTGNFGQFEVHGCLATVYVWADLYYCPGLTNAPARERPEDQTATVQIVSTRAAPSFFTQLNPTGASY